MNSRTKGKTGELELAKKVQSHGIGARRGQQFAGGGDSPDVVTELPNAHFECKRTEKLLLYPALDQAIRDAAPERLPIVAHRCSLPRGARGGRASVKGEWIAIMRLDDLLPLLRNAVETW